VPRGTAPGHSSALVARVDLGMEARAAAADHSGSILTRHDLGMEARALAAGHSSSLLPRLDLGCRDRLRRRAIPVPYSIGEVGFPPVVDEWGLGLQREQVFSFVRL
jgi:hypothetical protein